MLYLWFFSLFRWWLVPTLIPLLIHTSAVLNQNPPIINNRERPVLHNFWNSFVRNSIHRGFASTLMNIPLQSPLEPPHILAILMLVLMIGFEGGWLAWI